MPWISWEPEGGSPGNKANWVRSFPSDEAIISHKFQGRRKLCQILVWFSFYITCISIFSIYFIFLGGWSLNIIFQKLRCLLLIYSDSFLSILDTFQAVFFHSGSRYIIIFESLEALFVCLQLPLFWVTRICRQILQHQTSGSSSMKLLRSPCSSYRKGMLLFWALKFNRSNRRNLRKRLSCNNKI